MSSPHEHIASASAPVSPAPSTFGPPRGCSLRRAGAAALGLMMMAPLIGCAPEPGTEEARARIAEKLTATALTMPAEFETGQVSYGDYATAVESGAAPGLLAAVKRDGAQAGTVVMWRSVPGTASMQQVSELPEVAGDVQRVDVAQDEATAVLVGASWDGERLVPFAWRSEDRTSWTPIDLGDLDARLADLVVSGGKAYAVTVRPEGKRGVVVLDLASGSLSETPLTTEHGEERLEVIDLEVRDAQVVLIGQLGVPGQPERPVAVISGDGAASFADPTPIGGGGAGDFVNGLALTNDGYVATGKAGPDIPNAEPVLWRSPDGVTWTPSAQDLGELAQYLGEERWFTQPTAADDGRLYFRVGGVHDQASWYEARDGRWMAHSSDMADLGSSLLPMSDPANDLIVYNGEGSLGTVRFALEHYDEEFALTPKAKQRRISAPDQSDATRLLSFTKKTKKADGWVFWYAAGQGAGLTPGDVVLDEWRPEGANEWTSFMMHSEDGITVAAGTVLNEEEKRFGVDGRVTRDGETWQPFPSVVGGDKAVLDALSHVGDTWYVVAEVGERIASKTDRHTPRIWESTDGVNFTYEGEDLRLGGDNASVYDVCATPGGDIVAVGQAQGPDDRYYPATWRRTEGGWEGKRFEKGGTGHFGACRLREDDLLLMGEQADFSRTWNTTDGAEVTEEETLPEGVTRDEPVAIASDEETENWVAGGFLDTTEHYGPVVWLSKDGAVWDWYPLPGPAMSGTPSVAMDGEDLIVLGNTGMFPLAWRIPEVRAAF